MINQYYPTLQAINQAKLTVSEVSSGTPLTENLNLSHKYGANVMLKREDL